MFIVKGDKPVEGATSAIDSETVKKFEQQIEELMLRIVSLERICVDKLGMTLKELTYRFAQVKQDALISTFDRDRKEVTIKLDPVVITNEHYT